MSNPSSHKRSRTEAEAEAPLQQQVPDAEMTISILCGVLGLSKEAVLGMLQFVDLVAPAMHARAPAAPAAPADSVCVSSPVVKKEVSDLCAFELHTTVYAYFFHPIMRHAQASSSHNFGMLSRNVASGIVPAASGSSSRRLAKRATSSSRGVPSSTLSAGGIPPSLSAIQRADAQEPRVTRSVSKRYVCLQHVCLAACSMYALQLAACMPCSLQHVCLAANNSSLHVQELFRGVRC